MVSMSQYDNEWLGGIKPCLDATFLSFSDCVHLPTFFKPLFKSYFLHLINMCMFSNNPSTYLVSQSYPTLCDPMDCSPPGSSVCGILQARILEWVAISSSRGSSQRRDQTCVSCIAGRFFIAEPSGKPQVG